MQRRPVYFQLRTKLKNKPLIPAEGYRLTRFQVGEVAHDLALHRDPAGDWCVSDIRSGAQVLRVRSTYQCFEVRSRDVPVSHALAMARAQVLLLCERVGADKFNSTLLAVPAAVAT